MANTFRQPFEQATSVSAVMPVSTRPVVLLGIACIALCALYVISIRMVEASDYALRDAVNARGNLIKQYGDLGTQLDSLRSLSVISQAPVLAGFQEVQKPLYLNMDMAQSVAVANGSH